MTNFGKKKLIINLILAFMIIMPFVLGATNFLESIFAPFKGVNVGLTYLKYAAFIDAILYFWLFIAIAKGVFKDKFPTSVATVVGLILAIGMCVFEYQAKFNLGMLSWIPFLILCFLIGYFFYKGAKEIGATTPMAIFLGLILPLIVINMSPGLMVVLNKLSWWPGVYGWLLIVVLIFGIYAIINLFKGIKSGDLKLGRAVSDEEKRQKEETKLFQKEQKAEQDFAKVEQEMPALENKLNELETFEANDLTKEINERKKQIQILTQLDTSLVGASDFQKRIENIKKNIANPAYAQYINNIQTYSEQLEAYINKISAIIATLPPSIQQSIINTNELLKKVEPDTKQILDKLLIKEKMLAKDHIELIDKLKSQDPLAYQTIKTKIDESNKNIKNNIDFDKHIKQQQQIMMNIQKDVEKEDKNDLNKINTILNELVTKKSNLDKIHTKIKDIQKNTEKKITKEEQINNLEKSMTPLISQLKQTHQTMMQKEQEEINAVITKTKQDYDADEALKLQILQEYEQIVLAIDTNPGQAVKMLREDLFPKANNIKTPILKREIFELVEGSLGSIQSNIDKNGRVKNKEKLTRELMTLKKLTGKAKSPTTP